MTTARPRRLDDRLRDHLSRFPRKKVERFIFAVTVVLAGAEFSPQTKSSTPPSLTRLKKIAQHITQLKQLSVITVEEHMLAEYASQPAFRAIINGHSKVTLPDTPSLILQWMMLMPYLEQYLAGIALEITRRTPKRRGRKAADADHVLKDIAEAYLKIIGEIPTTTPGRTFHNIAVEILGRDRKSIDRPVRAAVQHVTKFVQNK